MKSKIQSKINDKSNSPLASKNFPTIDMSRFQMSNKTESSSKNSTKIMHKKSIQYAPKIIQSLPNLFQYNDRAPLILSSDEEQQFQPSFRYESNSHNNDHTNPVSMFVLNKVKNSEDDENSEDNREYSKGVKKQSISQIKKQVQVQKQKNQQNSKNINEKQIELQKKYLINKSSNQLSNKRGQASPSPFKAHKQDLSQSSEHESNKKSNEDSLNFSKSQQILIKKNNNINEIQKQNSLKSVFSKTDQIIQYVNSQNNHNILIQQQSNKSSQKQLHQQINNKNTYLQPIPTTRDSTQSNPNQKKRRNRIFGNSSIRRQSRPGQLTPEKGVQVQLFTNKQQQFERTQGFYPQIKALGVLDKIVDQIGPQPTKSKCGKSRNYEQLIGIWDKLNILIDRLNVVIGLFKNIRSLDRIQDIKLSRQIRQMRQYLMNEQRLIRLLYIRKDDEYNEYENRIINNILILLKQYEIIQQVYNNYMMVRDRLRQILINIKKLKIIVQKKQYRILYNILKQIKLQIQKLKQLKSICGNNRLQKLFKQYLQIQINQLTQVYIQNRLKYQQTISNIN